nr:hypothetical protein [Bovine gammaherpesvirus 4]
MTWSWLQWLCCSSLGKKYEKVPDGVVEVYPTRWSKEIELGLPPGVNIGDLLQASDCQETLYQSYLLAIQSNNISDYLMRFDSVKIPDGCQGVVSAQIAKLKSVQNIIWNTMISMAVGSITIDDAAVETLLERRAGDTMALMEMEKLANAIKMDVTQEWAGDIDKLLVNAPPTPHGPPKLYGEKGVEVSQPKATSIPKLDS